MAIVNNYYRLSSTFIAAEKILFSIRKPLNLRNFHLAPVGGKERFKTTGAELSDPNDSVYNRVLAPSAKIIRAAVARWADAHVEGRVGMIGMGSVTLL